MCNARNHPPGCNCGWGQGRHNGGYGFDGWGKALGSMKRWLAYGATSSVNATVTSYGPSVSSQDSKHAFRGSWVNPNAVCPVCGDPVYFYCSPDGGRVYFDELGPPWPKHACTDQAATAPRFSVTRAKRWDQDEWQPLVDFDVSLIDSGNLYRIVGNAGPYERKILFRLDGMFQVEIVRFSEKKGVEVELSLLARDRASGEWLVCEGIGKLASNYPPGEMLRVVERIPNAPERALTAVAPTSNNVLNTCELGTLPAPSQSEHEPAEAIGSISPQARVAEIDAQIRVLLAEISILNDEKSRLFARLAASNEVQGADGSGHRCAGQRTHGNH